MRPRAKDRSRPGGAVGLLLAAAAVASTAGGCGGPSRPGLTAAATMDRGWIGLRVDGGAPGSRASVREGGATVAEIQLDHRGAASVPRIAPWRCSPRTRRLTVEDGVAGSATVTARTPSCARRLAIAVSPRRPHAGRRVVVGLRDRWRRPPLDVSVCLVAPAATRSCAAVRVGRRAGSLRLRAPRAGHWKLRIRGGGVAVARHVRVRPAGTRLKLLATGDSLVAPVARALGQRLGRRGRVLVRPDVHFGAGLSTPWTLDWRAHAAATARDWRPDVVVLFLGGGDAYPLGGHPCCRPEWQRAYGGRAREVARRFLRRGAAQVYWLTLPAARDPEKAGIWQIENMARAQALHDLSPWVREIDLVPLLSPGSVWRRTMVVDGRVRVIRAADGVHLTRAGGRLAASEVIAALGRDRILP
jgi:hypothetical protein